MKLKHTTTNAFFINLCLAMLTGFIIERCCGLFCLIYTPIGQTGANVTTFSDTRVTSNTRYYYRVRAFNSGGSSDYSNILSVTTLP